MGRFKSQAQRKKFEELLADGKITQELFDEWDSDKAKGELPDRLPKSEKKHRKSFINRRHSRV